MKRGISRVSLSSAIGGGVLWAVLAATEPVGEIELLLLLAPLVLVPILLDIIATPTREGTHSKVYLLAVFLQPIAALCATAGLILQPGVAVGAITAVWVLFAVILALFGIWRLLPRGFRPIEELLIDAGLLYIIVGALALFLNRLGVAPLGFSDSLVLLTGVHFHYAGFVLPVLTGISGRVCTGSVRRAYVPVAVVVLFGPGLIGLGITFSPLVEIISVAFFTTAVTLLALLWLGGVVPARENRLQQTGLSMSALVLPASMALALLFGVSRFLERPIGGLEISTMVDLHGHLNALGFALLGALGWRLDIPLSKVPRPGIPLSSLTAGRSVGAEYFERAGVVKESGDADGQVEDLSLYSRPDLDIDAVHPDVRRFYEQTSQYELSYKTTWHRGFRSGAGLAMRITGGLGQLSLPVPGSDVHETTSRIVSIDGDEDSRSDVLGWVRRDRNTDEAVFVSAYSTHEQGDETFMNVALPLPGGNMTAVLRVDTFDVGDGQTGIELHSTPRTAGGDPGLYFVTPVIPIRLPMHERFRVWPVEASAAPSLDFVTDETVLVAQHEMWVLGRQFLTIDYAIAPSSEE